MTPAKKPASRRSRTTAEWTTFAIAVAILLGIVAAIVLQAVRSNSEAQPVATIGETVRLGQQFHVTVSVKNTGDLAAANVQVNASLETDVEVTEGDQVIDFLAGGDTEELVFVFDDDPSAGELKVEVTGFSVP